MGNTNEFNVGQLSIYWRTKPTNEEHEKIPSYLDFSFSYNEELELIQQKLTPHLMDTLDLIYAQESNVGYLQEGHDLAASYGGDFIRFANSCFEKFDIKPKRILEVGCGGCYLLKQFKDQGKNVIGVDPSPIAVQKSQEFGIPLLQGYFPEVRPEEDVDFIYHINVLEHVPDPVDFLRNQGESVCEGGWIIISVPDCTQAIKRGDLSMVIHQHLSFFDQNSLSNTVSKAGFNVKDVQFSKVGGSLYCIAQKTGNSSPSKYSRSNTWQEFKSSLNINIEKLTTYLSTFKVASDKQSLGVFVPLRGIPYLSLANFFTGFRFFEDDRGMQGRYFDGFDVKVESRQNLIEKPVTNLLIASWSYGEQIKNDLAPLLPQSTEILTLNDIVA